jgi:hypothetical protein
MTFAEWKLKKHTKNQKLSHAAHKCPSFHVGKTSASDAEEP